MANLNVLQWDGTPGHYEVYYLSATEPATGIGLWIRYTMVAPMGNPPAPATCSLWLMAMDPAGEVRLGRKVSYPVEQLVAEPEPFRLRIADSELSDRGMAGGFDDVSWELSWTPSHPPRPYEHVHPLLRRLGIAKTVLTLPHADVAVRGTVTFAGRELKLDGARGGQAHLWGSKHANRWAWVHCNDFAGHAGAFVDGVSVFVPRFGREIGPSTPVVGRLLEDDFVANGPAAVVRAPSTFDLTSWNFEATAGRRRIVCEVSAPRDSLVGVTYHDPDGAPAYCYNSEASSMRVSVYDRIRRGGSPWMLRDTLESDGRAHFEYAQREPVAGLELHVT
jgi:hypothetical protein